MRVAPQAMTDQWNAVMKGGEGRATVRATILTANLKRFEYDTSQAAGGSVFESQRSRTGHFTSIIFGDAGVQRELPNIKSCRWTRSEDQDVATCTLVLANSAPNPIGVAVADADEFDQPGFYTYNRGDTTVDPNPWGYTATGWNKMIMPDRLVKTYEGYGGDPSVVPALDTDLMQSGTWLIDKVTYADNGEITLEMRDVGRLLLDQIVYPPAVPFAEYPLSWEKIHSVQVPGRDVTGGSWGLPDGTAASSNTKYLGQGIDDSPHTVYVGPEGSVDGHKARHALNEVADDSKYWLSTGQTTSKSKVYWEVDLDSPTALNGVRIHTKGGPYRVYISVKKASGWVGRRKIPYEVTTGGVDIDANVPYVKSVWADRGRVFDVTLPRKYGNVTKVRLTFTHLWDTRVGGYPWRAGLKMVKLYTAATKAALGFAPGTVTTAVGNYEDYTQIIKWVTAWGGFFWPPPATGLSFIHLGPGNNMNLFYDHAHPSLPIGRVWGDFMRTGTYGVAPLGIDLFDKQPLMDIINYVRDVVGFYFCIDEQGAVVWRMPNLWALGNYLSPSSLGDPARSRTANIITIDERETLLNYSTTLDSADIRERLFVATSTGKFGTVIKGYTPINVGFRRIAGWTDQRFETKAECRVMADLLAAQSMFNYRRSQTVIPGYPAIQVDDQVRVLERVTNETFHQYVVGITSDFDAESREWTYTLDTHWLGERPADAWTVRVNQLAAETQAYLALVGEDNE